YLDLIFFGIETARHAQCAIENRGDVKAFTACIDVGAELLDDHVYHVLNEVAIAARTKECRCRKRIYRVVGKVIRVAKRSITAGHRKAQHIELERVSKR